jgi:hypothetical protein
VLHEQVALSPADALRLDGRWPFRHGAARIQAGPGGQTGQTARTSHRRHSLTPKLNTVLDRAGPGVPRPRPGRALDEVEIALGDFLKLLLKTGYRGRVGLQGYGVPGPSEEHLGRSMRRWRELMRQLQA